MHQAATRLFRSAPLTEAEPIVMPLAVSALSSNAAARSSARRQLS